MVSRMFPFITRTWNPVVGCKHDCEYCWARRLAEGKLKKAKRYAKGFKPQLIRKELQKSFKADDFVFVCDMGDLFGSWVPDGWIAEVFAAILRAGEKGTQFLLLTKNPHRYVEIQTEWDFGIPHNCVCGATVESDIYWHVSGAEKPVYRLDAMQALNHPRKFVAIEPILNFNLEFFAKQIIEVKPWAAAVGYDNYGCGLPEPPLAKTMQLIDRLEKAGITVYRKTLREAWDA